MSKWNTFLKFYRYAHITGGVLGGCYGLHLHLKHKPVYVLNVTSTNSQDDSNIAHFFMRQQMLSLSILSGATVGYASTILLLSPITITAAFFL